MSAERLIAFDNVRLFDGKDLHPSGSVLVSGDRIQAVSTERLETPSDAIVIDGGGRVLSPGFIATHEHLLWSMNSSISALDDWHWSYIGALGVLMARRWLDWGFTTVRSAGGRHWVEEGHRRRIRSWAARVSLNGDLELDWRPWRLAPLR